MAQIKDTLELVDRFSAPLGKYEKALNSLQMRLQATELQQERLAKAGDLEGAEALNKKALRLAEQIELRQTEYELAQRAADAERSAAQMAEAEIAPIEEAIEQLEQKDSLLRRMLTPADKLRQAFVAWTAPVTRTVAGIQDMGKRMQETLRPADGFTRKIMRMVATLFTARKLMRYIRDGLGRATGDTAASLERAGNALKDTFARITVSALQRIAPALDRLVTKLESPAGQRFARGLERIAEIVGGALAWAIDKVAAGIEWIGNNFSTLLAIAAPILAALTAKMIAFAVATAMAHLPLIAIITIITAIVAALNKLGVSTEQIVGYIAGAVAWLGALVWNVVVGTVDAIIQFLWTWLVEPVINVVEWIYNAFNGGFDGIGGAFLSLLGNMLSGLISFAKIATKIIDAIFGTSWTDSLSTWQNEVLSWGKNENAVTFNRTAPTTGLKRANMSDAFNAGYAWGENLANSFSGSALDSAVAPAIKNIDENTSSIKKSISAAEEDIASLVDIAQRRYINQINLTAQTPVINITGQNTGNTDADARRLADTIKRMLIEQSAAGSTAATAMP